MRHGVIPLPPEKVSEGKNPMLNEKMTNESWSRGKALYTKHCQSCHGLDGLGDGPNAQDLPRPPANLRELVREVSNFKFFMSISQWDGKMPGWMHQFSDAENEDLVAYIKSFK